MGARKIIESASEADLVKEVSRLISSITGVVLGEKQKALVQGRLAKRMRDLKITSPADYARHLNQNQNAEIGVLTSLLTTHHTFFFREFQHFDHLLKTSLPMIIEARRGSSDRVIRIWSAASSRGQEVYSLAMFLKHHLPQIAPDMTFEIIGSDVCEESIAIAKNGVYPWEELRSSPAVYLQGNWDRGTGEIASYVRAKDALREHVSFKVINLQELARQPFGSQAPKFDAVFCRNVFIYFTQEQVRTISMDLVKHLHPAGQLYVGLSETLSGLNLPLEWTGPSVFSPRATTTPAAKVVQLRPKTAQGFNTEPAPDMPRRQAATVTQSARRLRVLCVDDSPTVILLLKRILTAEKGFEIVGTAVDGIEAYEKAKILKPDVITLDIHMPRMNGAEFLEKHHAELQVPVVVVSSVSRDDSGLAFRCLELGAADYIEKPSVQNLEKLEDELHFKLRVAVESGKVAPDLALDSSFRSGPVVIKPEGKMRVVTVNFASRDSLFGLLYAFQSAQPPSLVLVDGAGELFASWASKVAAKLPGGTAVAPLSLRDLKANTTTFMEFDKGVALLEREGSSFGTSCLVFGPLNANMEEKLLKLPLQHMILEDRGRETSGRLIDKAKLIVPITSFVYESDRFFSQAEPKKAGGPK